MAIDFNDLLGTLRADGKLILSRLVKASPGKKIVTDVQDSANTVTLAVEDETGAASNVAIPKTTTGNIGLADSTDDGLMSAAGFNKLAGIEDGATAVNGFRDMRRMTRYRTASRGMRRCRRQSTG